MMHDQYAREKPCPVPPLIDCPQLLKFELKVQRPQQRLLSRRSVSGIDRVFFHPDPHFDIFLATTSQRTAPAVLPYWDLVSFRVGYLVLILRPERSERPPPTRPPTEIQKSLFSRYWVILRRAFKMQRRQPLCRIVDGENLGCWQPFDVGHDNVDSHPVD